MEFVISVPLSKDILLVKERKVFQNPRRRLKTRDEHKAAIDELLRRIKEKFPMVIELNRSLSFAVIDTDEDVATRIKSELHCDISPNRVHRLPKAV